MGTVRIQAQRSSTNVRRMDSVRVLEAQEHEAVLDKARKALKRAHKVVMDAEALIAELEAHGVM